MEWNAAQPAWISSASSNSADIYGSLLGYNPPGTAARRASSQSFQIGVNASTDATTTADPASMAGLRLQPGSAISWVDRAPTGSAADGGNTFGMPQNGAGFTARLQQLAQHRADRQRHKLVDVHGWDFPPHGQKPQRLQRSARQHELPIIRPGR